MSKKIVITRPYEQGSEFLLQIVSHIDGVKYEDIIFEPLLKINKREIYIDNVDKHKGVIVTSCNAIHSIEKNATLKKLPFYCVGHKTAKLLMSRGVENINHVALTAHDLFHAICNSDCNNFLYLRGRDISFDLSGDLKRRAIIVTEAVCYEAMAVTKLSDNLLLQLRERDPCLITFFSKRTAEVFSSLLQYVISNNSVDFKKIHILCISDSVLECLNIDMEEKQCYVADTPDMKAMLTIIGDYCMKA